MHNDDLCTRNSAGKSQYQYMYRTSTMNIKYRLSEPIYVDDVGITNARRTRLYRFYNVAQCIFYDVIEHVHTPQPNILRTYLLCTH
jgi:hypothetical protein